jgi:zinc protease
MNHEMKSPVVYAIRTCALFLVLTSSLATARDEAPLPKDLPPFGPDKPLPVARIDQSTLSNGLQVWIVPRPGLPRFAAYLAVRGGTAADPAGKLGISRVLGDVLTAGTSTRTSRQIAEELQAVGAEMNAAIGDDAYTLSVEGISTGSGTMLAVLSDIARYSSLPDEEVELAKGNAIQGLMASESRPGTLAEKLFADVEFGSHPYALVLPERSVLESITPEMLREEFHRRFRPDHALLVVAGAMDPKGMKAEIEKAFGGWKSEGQPVPPTPPAPSGGKRRIRVLDRPGSIQSEIRVGRAIVPATHPDYYPLLMANTILGGSGTDRLYQNIREDKGYTYTPSSSLTPYERGGTFEAEAAVRNEVTAGAILEILYEFDRLGATPTPAEELARAKRFQTGIYLLRNETCSGVANSLCTYWIRGQDATALTQFVSRIDGVTAEKIREVGRMYLSSRQQTVAIVGDAKAIIPDLEQFGQVEVAAQ